MIGPQALIQTLARRLTNAILTIPAKRDWAWAIALLLIYGAVFLPIGLASGFLRWQLPSSLWVAIGVLLRALLMPGLSEELFFRVLLIPHPSESVSLTTRRTWVGVSWISFVLYHPLNPAAPAFFGEPIFLLGAGLLGIACTIAYLQCGSLWTPVMIHWLAVVIWLLLFDGLAKF